MFDRRGDLFTDPFGHGCLGAVRGVSCSQCQACGLFELPGGVIGGSGGRFERRGVQAVANLVHVFSSREGGGLGLGGLLSLLGQFNGWGDQLACGVRESAHDQVGGGRNGLLADRTNGATSGSRVGRGCQHPCISGLAVGQVAGPSDEHRVGLRFGGLLE